MLKGIIRYFIVLGFAISNVNAQIIGGMNPNDDFDGDGIINSIDIDDDNDGIPDEVESHPPTYCHGNIVVNGDFSNGFSGFTTTYSTANITQPGNIAVCNNCFMGAPSNFSVSKGNNLQVNGGGLSTFWCQTLTVQPNTTYTISFYAFKATNDSKFEVTYNGTAFMTVNLDASPAGWNFYTSTFTVGNTSSVNICLKNLGTTVGASDYVIDDICVVAQNYVRPPLDTDGDGIPNSLDRDSDNDGCSDAFESGSTTNKTDSIIAGPYGTNGLANSKETVVDNGIINYSLTYDFAINSNINSCLDKDLDNVNSIQDIDDDNDGIIDHIESPTCFFTASDLNNNITVSTELSMHASYVIQSAFDKNEATSSAFAPSVDWVGKELFKIQSPTYVQITGISLDLWNWALSSSTSNTFKLQASNDNINWVDLSNPLASTATSGIFIVPNTLKPNNSYKLYRIIGVAGVSFYGGIKEISMNIPSSFNPSRHPKPNCIGSDFDNDGIPNHLDLDSDNDGCPDAYEGGASINKTDSIIAGPYGTNGLANSKEIVADNGIINYNLTYSFASNNLLNACIDSDGDGISDIVDIDDDNDGVPDIMELSCAPFSINGTCTNAQLNTALYGITSHCSDWKGFDYDPSPSNTIITNFDYLGVYTNGYPRFDLQGSTGSSATTVLHGKMYKDFPTVPGMTYTFQVELLSSFVDVEGIKPNLKAIDLSSNQELASSYLNGSGMRSISFIATGTITTISIGLDQRPSIPYSGPNQYWVQNSFTVNGFPYQDCVSMDTDGDGIPNHLDSDSDNDGCSDAFESGATSLLSANYKFPAPYGANGLANSKETAVDNGIINYTSSYDTFALNSTIKACLDTDKDGIADIIDIDDDNDGIPDLVECPSSQPAPFIYGTTFFGVETAVPALNYNFNGGTLAALTDGNLQTYFNLSAVQADNNIVTVDIPLLTSQTANLFYLWNDWGALGDELKDFEVELIDGSNNVLQTLVARAPIGLTKMQYFKFPSVSTGITKIRLKLKTWWRHNQGNSQISEIALGLDDSYCDDDNDGISNQLDLDSDNDGCSDAFESASSLNKNDTIVVGPYGNNGLANSKETALDNGVLNFQNTYYLATDSSSNACIDSDNDGISDLIDLDDDNDGVLDMDECNTNVQLCFDGSFGTQTLASIATHGCLKTVNASLDLLLPSWSTFAPGTPASPDGGAFYSIVYLKGTWNESSEFPVSGLKVGAKYKINFHQMVVGHGNSWHDGGHFIFRDKTTGAVIARSKFMNPTNPSGAFRAWEKQSLTFVATSSNMTIQIFGSTNDPNSTIGTRLAMDGFDIQALMDCDDDGDGIPNHLDLDSDNDGCYDAVESGATTIKTDSIIAGPYGTNGLANSKEIVVDNGKINYNLTYNYAISATESLCLDTDNDGIPDIFDIDDDNDGILDIIEQGCNSSIGTTVTPIGVTTAAVGSTNTINDYTPLITSQFIVNISMAPNSPPVYDTYAFANTLVNPIISFTDVDYARQEWFDEYDNPLTLLPLDVSPATVINGNVITRSNLTIPGGTPAVSGYGRAQVLGSYKKLKVKYIWAWSATNNDGHYLSFVQPNACNIGLDTDGDGIPNYLDRDSDGDGCSDAYEAGSSTNKTDSIIPGPYGTNGLANSKEIVADNGLINYNVSYNYALDSLTNACIDTDGDGIGDVFDLDDDNDGILDIDECKSNVKKVLIAAPSENFENIRSNWVSEFVNNLPDGAIVTTSLTLGDGIAPVPGFYDGYDIVVFGGNAGVLIDASEWAALQTAIVNKTSKSFIIQAESCCAGFNGALTNMLNNVFGTSYAMTSVNAAPRVLTLNQNNMYSSWFGLNQIHTAWYASMTGIAASDVLYYDGPNAALAGMKRLPGTLDNDRFVAWFLDGSITQNGHYPNNQNKIAPAFYNAFSKASGMPNCDSDNDGIPNHLDLDSDNDGCSDAYEAGSSINKADSIIAGPYGTNGLANSKEIVVDNGKINYNLTYNYAISATESLCLDTDNDGIPDIFDIDDDNDGILDIIEQGCNSSIGTTVTPIGVTTAAVGSTNTINDYTPLITSQFIVNISMAPNSPPVYDTYAFANTLVNPIISFADVDYARQEWFDEYDNPLTLLPLDVSPATVINGNVITRSNLSIPGGTPAVSGYGRAQVLGSFKKLKVKYVWVFPSSNNDGHYLSFVQPNACNIGLDTDGDGIPNYLDRDSDGDGCSDAFEAGSSTNKTDSIIAGPYGTNGLANSKETAVDNGIINYQLKYSNAVNSTLKACKDSDNDGIPDLFDLDSDNDGILDTDEYSCISPIPLVQPTASGASISYGSNNAIYRTLSGTVSASTTFINNQTIPALSLSSISSTSITLDTAFADLKIAVTDLDLSEAITLKIYDQFNNLVTLSASNIFFQGSNVIVSYPQGSSITLNAAGSADINHLTSQIANIQLSIPYVAKRIEAYKTAGSNITLFGITNACNYLDTDGDGIPNHLDLDSDNDGCSDALEAGATTNKNDSIIAGPYGTNGLANSKETATDNGLINYNLSYNYAIDSLTNACLDTDGDGIRDIDDIDDDNDGIPDVKENCFMSDPSIAATYTRTTGNYALVNGTVNNTKRGTVQITSSAVSGTSGVYGTPNRDIATGDCAGNASADFGVRDVTFSTPVTNAIFLNEGFEFADEYQDIEILAPYSGTPEFKILSNHLNCTLTKISSTRYRIRSGASCGVYANCPSSMVIQISGAFYSKIRLTGDGPTSNSSCRYIKIGLDDAATDACDLDMDNDGIPNELDLDSDGDGCSDAYEAGSSINLTDSIIAGPYGTNGLANSKETSIDNGIINYTLTYNRAINSSIKPCVKPDISGNIKSHCQKPGTYQVFAIPNPSNSGATLNWYNVPTGGTASSTAPTVNTANVGVYTFWVSQTLNGVESAREEVQITVAIAPATPGAISGPTSITQGSVNLHNIAAVAGATSYVWTLPNGWSGTSTTSTIIDTAGATGGFITVKASNNGCESAAASLQVFVSPKPPKPTISIDSFSYCQGDTASQLSATPTPANSGGILNWYTVPAGGTATSVAPTPNTNTSGIFTFFVSQTVNNIESDRAPIFVRVNAKPAQPVQINGPANIQANNSYTYSVTAISGATSYTWTLPNGWSGTSTTNSITINSNTTTTGTLKVKANADSCSSAEQTLIINTLPVKPDLSDNTNLSGDSIVYCQGATATQLQAKTNPANNGGTIKWYTQATGGTALTTAPTPSTTLAGTMTYYVSQTVNNIESERTAIRVIVKPTLSQPTAIQGATAVQANTSQTYSVTLVPGATSYTWTLPNGWTGTSTTNSITINTNTTTSGIVSVTANVNGCSSSAQTLTVGNLPTKPDLSDNTNLSGDSIVYCQGATATQLQAKTNPANNGGTIKWYTQATGGTALTTAPTPSTTLAGTTTYYVSQTVNSIESERTAIRVIVKPTLSQPTAIQGATAVQANTSQTYSVTSVPGATSYTWSLPNGWTGTSTTNSITINTNTTTSGIVSVTANVNGCSSSAQNLTVGTLPTKPDLSDNTNLSGDSIVYCQGATATQLQAKANPSGNGGTIKWYTQATGGTALTTAPTPNTTFSSLTTYYVSQTVNNIESERAPIRVIVKPTPSQPNSIQGNTTVVASTSNTYSVNSVSGATSYTWTLPGGWSGTSTTNSIVVTSGTTGGTIRVVAHVGPCSSAEQTLLVNIQGGGPNIDDNKNIVGNTITYCVGAKADPLVAKATVSNAILVWYTQPTGGSPSVMAPTPNTTSVDTQRYYVSQIADQKESLRTQIIVIITEQNCPKPCMSNLVPDITPLFITNTCPDTTADLTSIETKNQPNGSVLRWFTSLPASEQTRVLNPSQVKTGTYYAVFYNPTDSCYSLNGDTATKVQVVTSSCTNCNAGHVAPKLSTIGLSNICPSTTADLTLVTASNQPKGTTLEWHTSVPVSSATKVANPKSVTAGIYYAVFFDATNNCYSKSGTLATPLVVSITSCPNPCQAGPIAPKVSQEVLTNICPSTTANLTTITASNTPSGAVLQWHTGVPATSFNKVTNPSAVLGGTYYAVFFDATNNCYSGNGFGMYAVDVVITNCPNTCQAGTTKPSLSVNSLDNLCPKTTVDLTSVTASNRPAGTVLQWHTEMPATASNRVTTPSTVGAGTYYAIFYDTLNKCYTTQGYGSTPILVNITNCPNPCNSGNFAPEIIGSDVITNTCPSTTVNLNQFQVLNQPAGTTLVWHSKLPASSLNRIANPATYNISGKVYGLFFDSKNNCYSQGGQFGLEIQVILTSCPDTCRSGKETPKTSGNDELTNICPSLTTNLTNVTITNKPTSGSVVVQWHTALPATALNRIKTPSSVNSGVYYAVFYDTLQKCYSLLGQDGMQVNVTNTTCPKCLSPNQAPSFGLDSIGTDCPSTTANLNTISVNNKPKGVVVRWYTSSQILSSNVVSNPSAVGAGMYYATFYDTANNCFANNGAGLFTPIKVSLTVCCNSGYQAPKLSANELTNLCPDSMADLTRISATNQPTGVVLEWHTKTPAQSSTKVSNPYAVGPGIYYGVFYDVVNDCYTDGGIYTTPISVTRKACTTCNAGEASPLLNTEGISNACPSTTADLTKITASNRPVGIVMEWHTSSTVTATSRVNNPSAVGAGTYYAIFYDPTNTCYAGNGQATTKVIVTISNCSSPCNAGTTAPALSQKTVTNVCPSTTANLSNISASNRPAGTNLQWHTALPATTSNRVVNPNAVSTGTYYALFYDPTNNCYSGNGYGAQQVEVVIRNCNSTNPCDTMQTSPVLKSDTAINTCPSLTVNLSTLENPSINGYVITWHKGTPATDANRFDSPQFAKAGTYYASYYDTARTCYSLSGKATKQVTVTTFNCPLCYAGSEAPRLSVSTLNNNCPTATADLTQITSFNLPKNTQLTWHTSVPANATNRVANPSAVSNAGTYYAVFFDATNNCYSGNGSAAASVTVTLLDCNNLCAAGTESPKLNISNGTLKNICPAVFANLTSVTASNKPTAGQVVLQWHTALPANATNRVILPSSVTSGTYYAIFYDTINKCYAGNGNQATQVVVSIENCTNTCIGGSQQPAFNTDELRNTCPNLTADLTLLVSKNQPKGTVIEWRTESGQVVSNPKSVSSGRYVALFKDTVNNCYSSGTLNPLTVIQISCKEQVATNDYTQINNKKPGVTVIDLTINDTLTAGSKYSITPNGNPKRGTASIDPITGKLSYTITDTSFVGYDTITYQLCDTITNKCSTAYVIIALSNPKDTTVSNIDGKPEVIIPLGSVKGIPTKPVDAKGSYVIDTNPTNGTATIDSNGKLVYRPNAGACGKDSVKVSRIYSFSDGRPNEVYSYWVYIENPPCGPIAKNDYEQISNKKPGVTVIDLSKNDKEPLSGSKYSITPNGNPKRGTATIDPITGKLSYTITDTSFVGYDTITYQLCDTITNKCSTAYVIIALSNPKDTTVSNIDGKPEVVIPLDSVTGIPIKPVDAKDSYVIDTNPTNGTATIDSNGKLVYRPNPGACGKDSVKVSRIYSFSDGRPNEVYSYWVYIENPPCDDEIPNYISPNGDGANDKFVLPATMRKKYPNLRLSIYNRWGNMVWRSNGVYQNNWGGEHYDASNLPDGVYYYIIELENQNEKARTGFIQVMRH